MSFGKIAVSGVIALALSFASVASAQSYYPTYNYGTSYSSGCVNLSTDVSYGQSGAQVSQLQAFLVAQNYPGGGSWMQTGYFGAATLAALRDFQQSQNIPVTGVADATTRAAIANVSCGFPGLGGSYSYGNNYNYSQPYNYSYNYNQPYTYNQYPYNYGYPYNSNNGCGTYPYYTPCYTYNNYGSAPSLTSLSPTSAVPGASITLYGTSFDPNSNTVYVGGQTLWNVPSTNNGTSLTFTLPSTVNFGNTVSVSVGNSHGTSNTLTLNVNGGGYPYPCGSGYNYCPPSGALSIAYLSPQSGAVGTSVTVFGSGFSSTGNSVHFGNGVIGNLSSNDGYSVSFVVPSSLTGYGYQPVGLGTYQVSVTNASGATSNAVPFTITAGTSGSAPVISNVTGPTSLAVGAQGVWTVTVNNPTNVYASVSVNWGDNSTYAGQQQTPSTFSSTQQTYSFSHAYSSTGTYTVSFTATNSSGQSNASSVTVYVGGSGSNTGGITLSYLSPSTGSVGTQVVLQGSGFSTTDNTIHFGIGGTMHVPSVNGTTIYYTVPAYISACDIAGPGCGAPAQLVTSGSYPVYVTTGSGTSQTLSFQVY